MKKLNWICEECLNVAKKEIIKLIYDFLIPDFNIDIEKMKIAFSGHRGYHLKIEDNDLRTLSSDERREIIDYITGEGISYEILENGSVYWYFSHNFFMPSQYSDFEFLINIYLFHFALTYCSPGWNSIG